MLLPRKKASSGLPREPRRLEDGGRKANGAAEGGSGSGSTVQARRLLDVRMGELERGKESEEEEGIPGAAWRRGAGRQTAVVTDGGVVVTLVGFGERGREVS